MPPKEHTSLDGAGHERSGLPGLLAGLLAMLVVTCLSVTLVFLLPVPGVQQERHRLGLFTVQRLADALADPLRRQDFISLNVALGEATGAGTLVGVAVYDLDSRLLASRGEPDATRESFSAEISHQEAVIGHVSIALSPSVALRRIRQFTVALVLLNLCLPPLLYIAVVQVRRLQRQRSLALAAQEEGGERTATALLKHRLRAIKLAPDTIRRAASLYEGELVADNRDELLIRFRGAERARVLNAVSCCALLINLLRFSSSTGELRGAVCLATTDESDLRAARHLANLASPNSLLISDAAAALLEPPGQVSLGRVQPALAPENGLLEVSAIAAARRSMIERQAQQLLEED